MDVCLLCPLD